MKKTFLSMAIAAVVLTTLAYAGATVQAKKPGATAGAPAYIRLDQADPHLGDWVTFTWSVEGRVAAPRIDLMCYQNGVLTYGEAEAATMSFKLGAGSSAWLVAGGEADCTATLYEWDFKPVQTYIPYAQTSFHAKSWR